ncbi:MAG TPA: hypothetical protein VGD91_29945 [Trebonia sp.]
MTCAAAGLLTGGRGKECTPFAHTANARRVPAPQPDQVVSVSPPARVAAGLAGHLSAARTRPISVVTGSGSSPWSPGRYGISGSSTEASWTSVTGWPTAQPGWGTPFTVA